MKRLAIGCLGLLSVLFGDVAGANGEYLEELIAQARAANLAQHPEWLALLHYQGDLLGSGYESLADGAAFFNAPDGKTNPAAELDATLARFFSEQQETDSVQNPQCAFIARYRWLKSQLGFDPGRLPERTCGRFEDWYKAINPAQLTLVFPAAYLNSPSSMFGHTLIRIDQPEQSERTRLISYAINYAAQTDETNGLVFALRGIAGGYPGYFSIMPYYEKVKEYSDLENRDIWEYQLNFTDEEIRRLLEHAWELGPIHFDYYFFDENCSYMLLSLLETTRPGLRLTERFPAYAIPSDTIRVLLEEEGLLRAVVYRPSNRTLIDHRLSHLSKEQEQWVGNIAQTGQVGATFQELAPTNRAQVLEVAHDYVRYQFYSGRRTREEAAPLLLQLLRERSRLTVEGETFPALPVPATRPDEGHQTARLALEAGSLEDSGFLQLKVRPAYHDLLDPSGGYAPGAQINFLDLAARYYVDSQVLELESLKIIDILSLTPRSRFFKPLSWRVETGLERRIADADRPLHFYLTAGAGISYALGNGVLGFGMVEVSGIAQESIPGDGAIGAGPYLGLAWTATPDWTLLLQGRWHDFPRDRTGDFTEYGVEQSLTLNKDVAMRFDVRTRRFDAARETQSTLSFHWYF